MRKRVGIALVLAAVVLLGAGGAVLFEEPEPTDRTANATTAGNRIAGVIGVQDGEFRTSVRTRALDARLAAADTPKQRAAVLDTAVARVRNRLETLQDRKENGSASGPERRAQLATMAAESRGLSRILDRSAAAARRLPADLRRKHDLSARIDALRSDVERFRSAELAAAARAIDGENTEIRAAPVTMNDVVTAYRRASGDLPGAWRTLFGTERIAVHAQRADGRTARFTLVTRDGTVTNASRGLPDRPTVHVYIDHRAVRRIRHADRPRSAAERSLARGWITYEGAGLANELKYGTAKVAIGVYDGLLWLLGGLVDLALALYGTVQWLLGIGVAARATGPTNNI